MQEFRERGLRGGWSGKEREREGGQQFLEITQGAFSRLVNPLWKSGLSSLLGCSKGEKAALPSLYNRPVSLLRKVNMNAFANKLWMGKAEVNKTCCSFDHSRKSKGSVVETRYSQTWV